MIFDFRAWSDLRVFILGKLFAIFRILKVLRLDHKVGTIAIGVLGLIRLICVVFDILLSLG